MFNEVIMCLEDFGLISLHKIVFCMPARTERLPKDLMNNMNHVYTNHRQNEKAWPSVLAEVKWGFSLIEHTDMQTLLHSAHIPRQAKQLSWQRLLTINHFLK